MESIQSFYLGYQQQVEFFEDICQYQYYHWSILENHFENVLNCMIGTIHQQQLLHFCTTDCTPCIFYSISFHQSSRNQHHDPNIHMLLHHNPSIHHHLCSNLCCNDSRVNLFVENLCQLLLGN